MLEMNIQNLDKLFARFTSPKGRIQSSFLYRLGNVNKSSYEITFKNPEKEHSGTRASGGVRSGRRLTYEELFDVLTDQDNVKKETNVPERPIQAAIKTKLMNDPKVIDGINKYLLGRSALSGQGFNKILKNALEDAFYEALEEAEAKRPLSESTIAKKGHDQFFMEKTMELIDSIVFKAYVRGKK